MHFDSTTKLFKILIKNINEHSVYGAGALQEEGDSNETEALFLDVSTVCHDPQTGEV